MLGNERADALARRALLAGDVVDVSVSLVEWRANVRRDVMLQWQNNWNLQHSWLRNIKPSVGKWLTASRYSRREEVVLSRLRLGSCLFQVKHYFDGGPRVFCAVCQVPHTIVHVLIDCPQFARARVLMGGPDQLKLEILLGDGFDHAKLFSFLRSVDFFGKI